MIKVIKRDGRKEKLNLEKLYASIEKAANDIKINITRYHLITVGEKALEILLGKYDESKSMLDVEVDVEKLQDAIEKALYICGHRKIREAYKSYRQDRTEIRETKTNIMKIIQKIGVETDRDNANVGNNFSAKLLRIASEANKWQVLATMPKDLAKEHEQLDLYMHDLDSFNLSINCLHIPTGKILKRGFNTGYGTIKTPKRITSAAELSCILLQASQNDMFGGQSHANFDNDLAYFVGLTRKEIERQFTTLSVYEPEDVIKARVEARLVKEVKQAMQSIVFNLNSMHSRAGSQIPFSSINMGIPESDDAALICKTFLEEYEKGLGKGEQPVFPNIIFRVKSGVNRNPEDPYYYLFKLACKVASKRMNPTFMNMDADFNLEWFNKGIIPATMGCRTYLMSNINPDGEPGAEGRGNNAPITINLPRLGIKAMLEHGEEDIIKYFFKIFDEKINKAHESLLYRHGVLKNLKVKDLPFVAGQGLMMGSENLNPDDSIEPILKNGTYGIGFIGLAETLVALTGHHHGENEMTRDLGEEIISYLRNKCDEFKEADILNWSCYATPKQNWAFI